MSWSRDLRLLLLATLTIAGITLATPAHAHHEDGHECGGDADVDPVEGGGTAGGECEVEPDPGPPPECDPDSLATAYYGPPDEGQMSEAEQERWLYVTQRYGEVPEGKVWMAAYNCAGVLLSGPYLRDDPDWPEVEALREQARAVVVPPLPEPNVSPPETVVNFDTWLWVDEAAWSAREESVADGSLTVRVQARPVEVTWDLVEGTKVCEGPGIPWSPDAHAAYELQPVTERGTGNPACTFRFVHSSTTQPDGVYHASVTVTWEFAWWLNGTSRGVFGTVDRTSDFDLRVGEIQALITD